MDDFATRALSTLVGALAAFGLAAWRQKREERRARVEKFKTALFILLMQRTFLLNLVTQQLAPKRDHPIRAFALLTILATPPTETLDVKGLAFLLVNGEGELLNRLTVAEAQYRAVVALAQARNDLHLSFQEKLEGAHEATQAATGTLDDIRRIAGRGLSARLEQMTDDLYRMTDDALLSNRDVYVSAVASFKRLFPNEGMFGVEDLPLQTEGGHAA